MIFDWFKIFNATEFLATDLVSRSLTVTLEKYGEKTILITRGNLLSITVDGVFLPVGFLDENPYIDVDETLAVLQDADGDVWLGIRIPE